MATDRQPTRTRYTRLKSSTVLLAAAISVSGCATAVYPFNSDYETAGAVYSKEDQAKLRALQQAKTQGQGQTEGQAQTEAEAELEPLRAAERCHARTDLALVNCQLAAKIVEIDEQHDDLINSPELFDVPLMLAAATASGLLLFDAGTTAVSAVGLGAGTVGAGRAYFSPSTARSVLRRGSAGYTCLLVYGTEAETYAAEFADGSKRAEARTFLVNQVQILRAKRDTPTALGLKTTKEADALIKQAEGAIRLFDTQAAAARVADSRLRMAAHSFGLTLVAQADRAPVDFGKTVQALIEQAKANADFLDKSGDAGEGAAEPEPKETPDTEEAGPRALTAAGTRDLDVAQKTRFAIARILSGMVSMKALVAGFDTCAVLAVPDATPPKIEIVFASVGGSDS